MASSPNKVPVKESSARVPLHVVVTLLCITSGSLDAISFLALGEAFSSVMTGNIVFMGVSVGTSDPRLALFCGIAIISYTVGVALGSWLANRWSRANHASLWPSSVMKTLAVQLALLATAAVIWLALGGRIHGRWDLAFLAVAAGVMGIQGAAVRKIGVPVSTTYMTGALTTLLEALVTGRRLSRTETSAIGGLSALAAGALLGSVVLHVERSLALLVPTLALGAVVTILLWCGTRRRGSEPHADAQTVAS